MKPRLSHGLGGLLVRQFWEFSPYYLGAFLALYLTHTFQSYVPFFAKEMGELALSGDLSQVRLWKFLAVALGILVARTASRLLFFYPARVLQKNLKMELIEFLETVHPARYRNFPSGQLYQIIVNDVNQMRALIGFGLLQVGNVLIALIVLLPKLMSFDQSLVWALLPLFLTIILFSGLTMAFQRYRKQALDLQGEVQNFIIESFTAKQTIQNYHAESSFIDLFRKKSAQELRTFYLGGIGVALSIPLVRLGFGLSLIYGAYIAWAQNLGASSLILLSGFLFLFLEPLMFLSWIGVIVGQSWGAWVRIKELWQSLNKSSERELKIKELNPPGLIKDNTQKIWGPFILPLWKGEVKIEINSTEWTLFAGPTGSGKSTLLRSLADVLVLQGVSCSLVEQSPYVYNDTLMNNLFLGRSPSEADKRLALELLDLFGLDLGLSGNELFDLEVGENGKRLSGGQGKRLCLVRSLLSETQAILWDDPFSSVDLLQEKKALEVLKNHSIMQGRTLIMTSHRLSTARASDRIMLLDIEGKIVEQGDSRKLLTGQSRTNEYFQKQLV